jgi:predicted enzyme related to lactoylglutathione lyase
MANPVVWFEVMGKNGENLRAFYGELFDWKFEVNEEMNYGMVEANGGQGIPGGVGGGDQQHVTFYVSTPSINTSLEAITKRGGKILMPRTELPGGTILGMFADPEGNAVGLVEEAA